MPPAQRQSGKLTGHIKSSGTTAATQLKDSEIYVLELLSGSQDYTCLPGYAKPNAMRSDYAWRGSRWSVARKFKGAC
jgi:hypothetical protein